MKKTLKKTCSWFLAVAMLLTLFSGMALAADGNYLKLTAEKTDDTTVVLTLSVTQAFTNLGSLNVKFSAPEGFTWKSTVSDVLTAYGNLVPTQTPGWYYDLAKGPVSMDVGDVLYVVTYEASSAIADGDYEFTAEVTDAAVPTTFGDHEIIHDTASCTLNVANTPTPSTGYTVAIYDDVDGTNELEIGDTVAMDVTVTGDAFNGMKAEVTYDKTLFELKSVTGIAAQDKPETDAVELYVLSNTNLASGRTVATLTFEAIAAGTGKFEVVNATVGDYEDFKADAVAAAMTGDTVIVKVNTYNVWVTTAENGSVTSDMDKAAEGETVTLTVTPEDGYELDTLTVKYGAETVAVTKVNDTTYTFTMPAADVTVDAVFVESAPETFEVTLGEGLTGDSTATAGTDYTASIDGYDPNANEYDVTVTIGGTEYTDFTLSEDGTITIPGADITGVIEITVTATPKFAVEIIEDYVTGVDLILATGDNASGYTYGGSAMYYVEQYEAFAYLTANADATQVAQAAAGAAYTTISTGYDVNGTGKVDFNDAGAAFGCYNVAYDVNADMAMYLRADVNGSKSVDTVDVNAIMNNYTAAN